ncbi:RNA polymerase, partial [Streptomyces tateyamensis]
VDAVAGGLPSVPPAALPSTAAPSSAAPSPVHSSPAPAKRDTPWAQQVLDLVNSQRAQHGCSAVTANAKLQQAAQNQSDDMAARNFFDHTNPDGAGPQQRIEAAGYQWSSWGENIARGQGDPGSVMESWMNSPGHRANILNCSFKELGVGIHQGPGGPWWTQDFGSPS